MKVFEHEVLHMLADGYIGEVTSIICLGAAIAVKRGTPIGEVSIQSVDQANGLGLQPAEAAALKSHLVSMHRQMLAYSHDDLDRAIALYREHLRRAGYSIEEGPLH